MGNFGAGIKLYLPIYLLGRSQTKAREKDAAVGGHGGTAKISTIKEQRKS